MREVKYIMYGDALGLLLYCSFIFYLSHQSSLPVEAWFEHQDKLMHGSAYAVMAILAWRLFRHILSTHHKLILMGAWLFCSLYGASDEFHQSFVLGRDADVWDWLADTLGAAVALLCLWQWLRKRA